MTNSPGSLVEVPKISIAVGTPASFSTEAIAVAVGEPIKLPSELSHVREAVAQAEKSNEFSGKPNQVLLLHTPKFAARRILLVGTGKAKDVDGEVVANAAARAASYLRDLGVKNFSIDIHSFHNNLDTESAIKAVVDGATLGLYQFTKYRTERLEDVKKVESLALLIRSRGMESKIKGLVESERFVVESIVWARDMGNTPAGIATPAWVAQQAQIAGKFGVRVKSIGKDGIKKLGMRALLAVSGGSSQPPVFLVLEYFGAKKSKQSKPVVLVGKGITFDSGGLNLKPEDGMWRIWHDKCGGLAVMATILAAARLKIKKNVVGLVPLTENLPGGGAYKPGDIVKTLSGKTIEIVNTDAEGRVVLADAFSYAQRYKPAAIIDLATLTGSVRAAFGPLAAGLFGNSERLNKQILEVSKASGERVWEMPLWKEYLKAVESNVADVRNLGSWGRWGGLPTSAAFLAKFAGETPWAHLDIASTAWTEEEKLDKYYLPRSGATGWGVKLLLEFLKKF